MNFISRLAPKMAQLTRRFHEEMHRYIGCIMFSIAALVLPPHKESHPMSRLAEFRQLEQQLAAQLAELEVLKGSSEL